MTNGPPNKSTKKGQCSEFWSIIRFKREESISIGASVNISVDLVVLSFIFRYFNKWLNHIFFTIAQLTASFFLYFHLKTYKFQSDIDKRFIYY